MPAVFSRTVDMSPDLGCEVGLFEDGVPLSAASTGALKITGDSGSEGPGGSGMGTGTGGATGTGTGAGHSRPLKLRSQANTVDAANVELQRWGMNGKWEREQGFVLPAAFQLENSAAPGQEILAVFPPENDVEKWMVGSVEPDEKHKPKYNDSEILQNNVNVSLGIHHTERVFTTETFDREPRTLPVNRRTLIINRWVSAGGRPESLRILSDGYLSNPAARNAFENIFESRGICVVSGCWTVVRPGDQDRHLRDDGQNPFPIGYERMAAEYPCMQTRPGWVLLHVDQDDTYHSVQYMERAPLLPV